MQAFVVHRTVAKFGALTCPRANRCILRYPPDLCGMYCTRSEASSSPPAVIGWRIFEHLASQPLIGWMGCPHSLLAPCQDPQAAYRASQKLAGTLRWTVSCGAVPTFMLHAFPQAQNRAMHSLPHGVLRYLQLCSDFAVRLTTKAHRDNTSIKRRESSHRVTEFQMRLFGPQCFVRLMVAPGVWQVVSG